jgi:hypothetical protein
MKRSFRRVVLLSGIALAASAQALAADAELPIYAETCLEYLKNQGRFPDRDQVRVESHQRKWDNFEYAGKKLTGQIATVSVNAKTAAGVYGGARSYTCHLSEDGRRVLIGP